MSGPAVPRPRPEANPGAPRYDGPRPAASRPDTPRQAPVPQQRTAPSRRSVDYQTYAGDVAPYSAVPYSAMPYSATPYSAAPYSAVPQPRSATPYSAAPYSGAPRSNAPQSAMPYSAVPYSAPPQQPYGHGGSRPAAPQYDEKPAYRDEPAAQDRYAADDVQQPAMPEYPASWGWAPERTASRPEWRSSPRARFSSR
jgi:hypothetical protein